jgi:hypothetical protein
METATKCQATTLEGVHCNAYALKDSEYCYFHEPSLESTRLEVSSLGGKRRRYIEGMPVSITSIEDILTLVGEVVGNLKNMDISINQAKAILIACESAMKALEYKELTDRVALLEEKLRHEQSH